jgi:predicted hotdog family 3-hydroxylacyl-ACP dehydratase
MELNRNDLLSMLPHGNDMVMIDQVLQWNKDQIECLSLAHHNLDNPFYEDKGFPSSLLIEICAQASAIHSSLNAATETSFDKHTAAFLASVKNARFDSSFITNKTPELKISNQCLQSMPNGASYSCEVFANDRFLFSGQLLLMTPK